MQNKKKTACIQFHKISLIELNYLWSQSFYYPPILALNIRILIVDITSSPESKQEVKLSLYNLIKMHIKEFGPFSELDCNLTCIRIREI